MVHNSNLAHCMAVTYVTLSPSGLCSVIINEKSIKRGKTSVIVFAFNLDKGNLQQRLLQFIDIHVYRRVVGE